MDEEGQENKTKSSLCPWLAVTLAVPKTGNSLEDRRIMMGFDVSTARASIRESTVYLKFSVLENEGWL